MMCNDGSNDSAGLAGVVGSSSRHNARGERLSKRCRDVEVGPFRQIGEVCEFASISGLLAGIPVKKARHTLEPCRNVIFH